MQALNAEGEVKQRVFSNLQMRDPVPLENSELLTLVPAMR
jgi:hypothetical protein